MEIVSSIGKLKLENGIIYGEYFPNTVITLDLAKKAVQDRYTLTKGTSYPVLADVINLKFVEDDAREYLSSDEACKFVTALAVVTDKPISNLFANVYLKWNRPPVPTKLFTNKEKAIRWLKLFTQLN